MSGSSVTNKLVRPRTKCSSESEERSTEQELNGLEEGEDAMTDEEGEGVDGEGEAGTVGCEQQRVVDGRQACGCRDADTAKFDGRRVEGEEGDESGSSNAQNIRQRMMTKASTEESRMDDEGEEGAQKFDSTEYLATNCDKNIIG